MKKSIFITAALFAFTGITNQLFAQSEKTVQGQHIKEAKLTCRVSATESGCSIVFEGSPPSSAAGMTASKKGYEYYMAKSSFSVSAVDNSVTEVKGPRDTATGQSSGKRMHKPTTVSSTTSSSDAVASSVTGGGAGKATFKEFTITKRCGGKTTKISCDGDECEIPTGDCPDGDCALTADWSWGMSQSGSSKRCSVDFLLEIKDGVCAKMAINEKGTGGTKSTTKK